MIKRSGWQTRSGFYLVAIGSAFGLGNIWRFPYVVGENGGGAFVLLYVFMALVVGMPMLIGELMLGRKTRQSIVVATTQMSTKLGWRSLWSGRMALVLCIVVLSYYSVISGWVLHFIVQYALAFLTTDMTFTENTFRVLMNQGVLQMLLASVHLLLCLVCLSRDVQDGLEKWINYIMPLFATLVIILVMKSLSLPSAPSVLRFLFYPDFSKLHLGSLNHALSHVFFTLSVGFGTMVTFGSYMNDSDLLPRAGFRVAMVDTVVSLIALLLLFPVAFQVTDLPMTDPALLFEVIPRFMLQIPGGNWFGFIFFICLYLAALNASIGLLEVIVSNLVDMSRFFSTGKGTIWLGAFRNRRSATWIAGGVTFLFSLIPALSKNFLRGFNIQGEGVIEALDKFFINWMLPIIALGISWSLFRGIEKRDQEKFFLVENEDIQEFSMFPHWRFVLQWLVPGLIILGYLMQILEVFIE